MNEKVEQEATNQSVFTLLRRISFLLSAIVLIVAIFAATGILHLHDYASGMPLLAFVGIVFIALSVLTRRLLGGGLSRCLLLATLGVAVLIFLESGYQGHGFPNLFDLSKATWLQTSLRGQTSLATGLCLAMLAIAASISKIRYQSFVSPLCAAVTVLSGVAILAYAYAVPDLHTLRLYNDISLHTAASLLLLAFAITISESHSSLSQLLASARASGAATRRQLTFCLLPIVAGGLLIRFVQVGSLSYNAAITSLVVLMVFPLVVLVLRDGKLMDRREKENDESMRFRAEIASNLSSMLEVQGEKLRQEMQERATAEAGLFRSQQMDAIGQLTGGIAHDFNNLLMTLRSNLFLLDERLGPCHPGTTYTERLNLATDRGINLTSQLLAFSRKTALNVAPANLQSVISGARDLIGNGLGSDIKIETHYHDADVWILTDVALLQLAILNLAINARDAMPQGSLLRISSSEAFAGGDSRSTPFVAIHVVDNGTGMSAAVIERAAERFFTTKAPGKGTGLGLSQVNDLAQQCGGELRIQSEVGRGTTIDILMPVTAPPPARPAKTLPGVRRAQPVSRAPHSILLVDDDASVRIAVAEVLRADGYEVLEAEDGLAALKILETTTPSAAVIDFVLPGLNGVQLARAAKASFANLPIIIVSGYVDAIAVDDITGAIVLRKPVSPQELLNTVSAAIVQAVH